MKDRTKRLRRATVFLFWVGMGISGVAQISPSARDLLQKAFQYQQSGNLPAAIDYYEQFLATGVEHPDVLSNLGAAYAGTGDYRKAIASYERALELQPENLAVRFNLGLAYYKAADLDRALEQFGGVLEKERNPRARLLSADIFFRKGENQKVIDLLADLNEEERREPAVAYLLGTALIRDGRVEEGQRFVDIILRQPDSAPAYLMLGVAHLMARELDQAASSIRKALELNPSLQGGHSILGQVLLFQKDRQGAKEAFEKELQQNPNDYDANLYLGGLFKDEQAYGKALECLERALLLRPQAMEAAYQLGTVHLAGGNPAAAREILEELVGREPGFIEAHVSLASAYYRLGMEAEADRERQIVIRLTAERDENKPKQRRTFGQTPKH